MLKISVVVPVFNERDTLAELGTRLLRTLEETGDSFEIILVDDGSSDGSLEEMKRLRAQDSRIRVLQLARNFGQVPALYAGFSAAHGEYILMIDADLQNYPEDIPKLLEKLEEGYDVVSGWRQARKDSLFRRWASRLLNRWIARITRLPLHDYGCSLKGFRREIVEHMNTLTHRCRYLPVDVACLSGNVAEVEVRHSPREKGPSKYNLFKLVRVAIDLLTGITSAPLQFIGVVGWLFALIGFGMGLRVFIIRFILGDNLGLESVVALFFVLSGVQMIATGLMCEYIGRIFIEVQQKPYFVIRKELE